MTGCTTSMQTSESVSLRAILTSFHTKNLINIIIINCFQSELALTFLGFSFATRMNSLLHG